LRITAAARLRLPAIGEVALGWSGELAGDPPSVTVAVDATGGHHASFVVEVPARPLSAVEPEVGIDLGLESFAVLPDGRKIANPRFAREAARELRRAQQGLCGQAAGLSEARQARSPGRTRTRPGRRPPAGLAAQGLHGRSR
jgi:putative transposase